MADRGLKRKNSDQNVSKSSKRAIDSSIFTPVPPPSNFGLPPSYGEWEDPLAFLARESQNISTKKFSTDSSLPVPAIISSANSVEEWEDASQFLNDINNKSSSVQPSAPTFSQLKHGQPSYRVPSAPPLSQFQNKALSSTPFSVSSTTTGFYTNHQDKPHNSSTEGQSTKYTGGFTGLQDEKRLEKLPVRNGVRVLPSASVLNRPAWSPYFSNPNSFARPLPAPQQPTNAHHHSPDLPRDSRGGVQVLPSQKELGSSTDLTPTPSGGLLSKPTVADLRRNGSRCLWRCLEGLIALFAFVPEGRGDFERLPPIPPIAGALVFVLILFAISLELLPFWILVLSLLIIWRFLSPQRQTVHVFVDHSNIVWSSTHQRRTSHGKKLSYPALVRLMQRPKNVFGLFSYLSSRCLRTRGSLFLAGSTPSHPQMRLETHQWEEAKAAGFEIRVLPRMYRECAVDDVIHKAIAVTILKSRRYLCFGSLRQRRDVIVIVSGDANDNEGHGGFPQQASLALEKGLEVEVWGMSDSLGRRGYASLLKRPGFRMFALDPYLDELYV